MSKDYFLRPGPKRNDRAPAFVQRAMTWAKSTNEIAGLVRGLLADGVVSASEAAYLRDWIKARPELLVDPLVSGIAARLARVFSDGVLTEEELAEIRVVLSDFAREDGCPTALPLDQPLPEVVVPRRTFCFTGVFVSGTRSWCEAQVEQRGGRAIPNASGDYLVIGSQVSGAWANQTYGRKISFALRQKRDGYKIVIISEDTWLRALET